MTIDHALRVLNERNYLGFSDWITSLAIEEFCCAPKCKTTLGFGHQFEWHYFRTEFEAIAIAEKLERESK